MIRNNQESFSLGNLHDDNEVLISSFLVKKPTLNTSSLDDQNETSNNHRHHNIPWKPNHRYWCVLRRGQFSYYKDETERKPEKVIPISDLIHCRIYDGNKLDIYTRNKTLRFKAEEPNWAKRWMESFKLLIHGDSNGTIPATPTNGLVSPLSEGVGALEISNMAKAVSSSPGDIDDDDNDDNDADYDDGFDVIYQTNAEMGGSHLGSHQGQAANEKEMAMKVSSVNNTNILQEDADFYEAYNPKNDEKLIQSGIIYGQVKNTIRRKKWKQFWGELTNRRLKLVSVNTDTLYAIIDLNEVVDCVELDEDDPYFALIVSNRRLKFKARNDTEMIDWIIHIKSSILVRQRISHTSSQ
ncbi:Opy1p Ecym_3435 [Eremothecium cymbalariae DBVPG|uniref:PH domain-containing protein n=1 Tax=Eremothecium cymbalariae (strain CBS 270.75 / DBVPG 7215 / KCTC 17166 / NRRL Y-17582) TaxID=931890 RepID=G8JS02_ERECY|nr:Hypothetical protein Ecym_3435 [Eremothecium cymbalariae DBVPG\